MTVVGEIISTMKRDRRSEILDAATRLFGAHGYGSTTTDQIAAAAGITKRTLYRHTGSKEHILLLIHERFLDAVDAVGGDETSGSADKRLRQLIDAYLRVVVDQQDAIRVFYEEMKNLSPESRASVVERRDAFERSVRQLIVDGQASGEFRATDVPLTASAILGGLANTYRWYSPHGAASPGEIAAIASDLFLGGLSASAGSAGANARESAAAFAVEHDLTDTIDDAVAARTLPPTILEAGLALFVDSGYMETSTREISARAGITKSALFYHIRSKEELLFAIHDELGRKSLAIVDEHLSKIASPQAVPDVLRRFIVAHCQLIDSDHRAVEIFIDQLRYLTGRHRERITQVRHRYATALQKVVEFGVDGGSLRAVNSKVVTLLVLGMLNSMYRWYRRGGRLSATQIGEHFADLVLYGLLRRP